MKPDNSAAQPKSSKSKPTSLSFKAGSSVKLTGGVSVRVVSKSTAKHAAAAKISKYNSALEYLKDR